MEMIADILLAAGALGAGFYCIVLGRRLNKFNDLEKGVGGAVAVLSAQVDDLNQTLISAQHSAAESAKALEELVQRAESTERQLALQLASCSDVTPSPKQTESQIAQPNPPGVPTPDMMTKPMFVRRHAKNGAH